jgi:ribose transport system ATP-binding protein
LFFNLNIIRNITIRDIMQSASQVAINQDQEKYIGHDLINRLDIRGSHEDGSIKKLSSGNKQKVVVAQCIYQKCKVYLFDEPTHGIDIAGKIEIYNIINELVRSGAGIIIVSSDFSELVGMSDSILVMKEGAVAAILSRYDLDNKNLFEYFV